MTTSHAAPPRAVRVAAQAKVNLRLRILARETSGYHQIETFFLRLALADDVLVRVTDGARSLDVDGDVDPRQLGPTERNLAWRAAQAYAAVGGWPSGFAIQLTKRIPIGGGLGGGSADAGAVLRALEFMAPSPIGTPALLAVAASLGADVPFLASERPFALGWGRGERLLALPTPAQREVLLLLPPFAVNTASAYGWIAAARDAGSLAPTPAGLLDASALTSWAELAEHAVNDFEPVVAARHPEITALVERLRAAGCTVAMMSGSGSSVFGVLPDGHAVDMPRFTSPAEAPAPRVLLTRTAGRVEPVAPLE